MRDGDEGAAVEAPPSDIRDPPSGAIYLVLLVSVLAMSWAAPLIRFSSAPPLVISFWRLAISLPFIGLVIVARGEWSALARMTGRQWVVAALAGVFLAAHFAAWIASIGLTSVAASVALVATQPVWVALFALVALGEAPTPRQWMGVMVAVAGAAVIGWGDLGGGRSPLLGDLLALAGAVLVAAYYVIGRSLRRHIGLWPYVAVVYGFAAAALWLVLVVSGAEFAGPFPRRDWYVFLALALGPMLVGHTGQNWALRFLPAHAVNLTLLGEPVGATLIAWLLPAIAERPAPATIAGGALILSGILLGVSRDRGAGSPSVGRRGMGFGSRGGEEPVE